MPVWAADADESRPCRVSHINEPGRSIGSAGAFRVGALVAWPGGGAYAQRQFDNATEVLVEDGRALVIGPRSSIADIVGPELDSHEVVL